MEILNCNNVKFLQSELLAKHNIIHGFSLRSGGVSEGEYASLNVGLRRGDNPFNAIKNIEICADSLRLNKEKITLTYQTHTNNVAFVCEEDVGKGIFKQWNEGVDGIVTDLVNVPLMCYSADCVPILLYDPKAKMIGAVHGGWRGTKEKIVKNAIKLMCEKGSRSEDIIAFIGPAIGLCCYEVSEDVGEAFMEDFPERVVKKENGKYMIDLKNITKDQLLSMGLKEENVENCEVCTSCDNELFFSHRRQNGKSGLLGGFIQMI